MTARVLLAQVQREVSDARLKTAAAALEILYRRAGPAGVDAGVAAFAKANVFAAIVDRRGEVFEAGAPLPAPVRAALRLHRADPTVVKVRGGGQQFRILVFRLEHAQRCGVVWRTTDTFADVDLRAAVVFALVIPVIVAFAFIAGEVLTRRALRSLYAVTAMATTIEATDLSRRIEPIPETSELAHLCATLNRMFARLDSAFQRQRRFTADASHELRTPLSVIIAEADLAADGLADEGEYRQAMRIILREAQTIEALTSNLLALARQEAGMSPPVGPVDVHATVQSAIERLDGLARARRIVVRCRTNGRAVIKGDRESLGRIPISLLHNALKFSDEGSAIDVEVRTIDGKVRLTVEDEGPGLSPEGLEHALERFWRGERRGEGSGLGLAIVKALVDGADGTIEIGNRVPRGCRVVVTFPAA
jgi:signal transduction histidine kinase